MARDNGPELDGWQVTAKPWDSEKCCPASCANVCESAQHAVSVHGEDWWMSEAFTLGSE